MKPILLTLLIASTIYTIGDNPGGCVWNDFQPVLDAGQACAAEFQKEQFVNQDNIKSLFNAWIPFSNKCLGTSYNTPKFNCYYLATELEKKILKLMDDVNKGESQTTISVDVAGILLVFPSFNKSCFPTTFTL